VLILKINFRNKKYIILINFQIKHFKKIIISRILNNLFIVKESNHNPLLPKTLKVYDSSYPFYEILMT
jgi:hypothetical protein